MVEIKINDHISLRQGITPEEGRIINNLISEAFSKGENVILDFSDVDMLTTAYLNVAIGELYGTYTSDELKHRLTLVNYSDVTAERIKRVTTRAKQFYDNPDEFGQIVDTSLYGKNN